METTFITIHDLSNDAVVLYASDSIVDILGHTPDEVVGHSTWDFFHEEEIPFARDFHRRGVKLDKAAVLAYCRIKNRDGNYVGCECCFSICYDVMVCCTSIYRRGMTSQKRAVEAPIVRKLFSSSVKDPRYHMLSHLSAKFDLGHSDQTHEPRAALFLNRFTRTLTIMYATSGIEQVIGISNDEMKGKSFYYCIQENCLEDAVRVLETAKGNDSIAYMRFWFRDPRVQDPHREPSESEAGETEDEEMTDVTEDEDDTSDRSTPARNISGASGTDTDVQGSSTEAQGSSSGAAHSSSGAQQSSDDSNVPPTDRHAALLGIPRPRSSASSRATPASSSAGNPDIEIEAVVSCTSDGLVVCLRKARPMMPTSAQPQEPAQHNGIFAAPWAPEPVFLPPLPDPYANAARLGIMAPAPPQNAVAPTVGGPSAQDFMRTIRDVAVFAWALTGINGGLADYTRGKPMGESQPPEGFPIWVPEGKDAAFFASNGSSSSGRTSASGIKDPFGDPGLGSRRLP
ncbi:uncharacterized protein BKA78DRAFT_247115 [Phyllosticta capitalensis]|uniref:uncharacterized protein n=1 Tax=Phyllosticta capitalensis TaxID=121624 RepID=UPI00312D1425